MEDILSQHSALASYRNNSLFTTLPHTADINILQNESREPTTEELQNVLGLQVHEYIHQLHNLSTIAGLQLLTNRLSSLRLFATGADENGHYIRAGKNYKHVEKSKLENFERDLNRILGNTGKISQEGFLKFLSFDRFEYSEETDDPTDPCNMLGIKITYELAGRKRNINIENVGYHIITEGIAYEIERQVRNNIAGNNGVQLEYSTPPFPYRFFRPIVEHLVGRSCSLEELVKVGTLALQNKVPSWGLKAASLALSHSAELFLTHAQDVMAEYEKTLEFYKKTVDHLTQSAFEGRAINQGLTILDEITKKAIAKRIQDPFYELEFVRENLSPEKFLQIIQDEAFPQRCIIQSKKNEESEEPEEFNGSPIETEVYWMGSGVMDYTEEMAGSISTLQCALQYSQLHLTTQSRFENTSSLGDSTNNHSCPYLNACPLKEDKSDQDLCSISPWMHDVGLSDGAVCWYVSGVKSLRNIDPDKYDDEYI